MSVLWGNGGAARGLILGLASRRGAANILIAGRSPQKAEILAEEFSVSAAAIRDFAVYTRGNGYSGKCYCGKYRCRVLRNLRKRYRNLSVKHWSVWLILIMVGRIPSGRSWRRQIRRHLLMVCRCWHCRLG